MPDYPKKYRMKPTESESRFTIESSQDYPYKAFSTPPGGQTGVGTIHLFAGGVVNPQFDVKVSVDKDKVVAASESITESVSVTVS